MLLLLRNSTSNPSNYGIELTMLSKQRNASCFGVSKKSSPRELDSSRGADGNVIEQRDCAKRQSQMHRLLDAGLDRTAKLAEAEQPLPVQSKSFGPSRKPSAAVYRLFRSRPLRGPASVSSWRPFFHPVFRRFL